MYSLSSTSPLTDLLGVGGHQVQAAGGDVEVDGHAGKLEVALPQDVGQGFGRRLQGTGRNRGKRYILFYYY